MFKVTNRHLRKSKTYFDCCRNLLNEERDQKCPSVRSRRRCLHSIKDGLSHTLDIIDYSHIISCFLQVNDKYTGKQEEVQDNK